MYQYYVNCHHSYKHNHGNAGNRRTITAATSTTPAITTITSNCNLKELVGDPIFGRDNSTKSRACILYQRIGHLGCLFLRAHASRKHSIVHFLNYLFMLRARGQTNLCPQPRCAVARAQHSQCGSNGPCSGPLNVGLVLAHT